MKKGVEAYFTLEAVLVLPLVIGVLGVVLYLLVYQYDRTVLEQDLGMLSVRVSSYTLPQNEVEQEFVFLQQGIAQEKYLLGVWESPELEETPGKVCVSGELRIPLGGLVPMGGEQGRNISSTYINAKLSPLFVIRSCNKIKRYWKKGED